MPELKQLLLDLSRAIVDCPDEVSAEESWEGDLLVYTLHVAKDDMGKIIGKHGKNAKCIRSVMKAAGMKYDRKIAVDIAEDDD